MADARIDQVADGVVARIASVWNPTAPDAVSWQSELPMNENDLIVDGRQVWVFDDGYGRIGPASRGQYVNEYRIRIVTAERYKDAAGRVPKAWLRARNTFVAKTVVDSLDYAIDTADVSGLLLGNLWTESIEVVEAYAPDLLAENKLFFSEVLFAFREVS